MKKLKAIVWKLLAGANVATIAAMMLLGYSDRINPAEHPMAVALGLAFPFMLAFNMLFLLFWLMAKPKYALIPIAGLLLCYQPVRTYIPLNIKHTPPAGALKVLSYNVWLFATLGKGAESTDSIVRYVADQQADIVCLQESTVYGDNAKRVDSLLNASYQHHDSVCRKGEDVLRIYSRFPIVGKERLIPVGTSASATAFHLMIDGDTVTVINCHLQSLGLSKTDKDAASTLVKGELERDSARQESQFLAGKLRDAAKSRAPQVDAIVGYIDNHPGRSIILCGDFNDGPISYTHRAIARRLTDCYVATGNGPGISYNKTPFYVRIDNVMCTADWQPVACKIDNEISVSDHYPIVCWLKKRPKP